MQPCENTFYIAHRGGSTVYKTKATNRTHAVAKVAESLKVRPSSYFRHISRPTPSQLAGHVTEVK